MHNTPGVVSGHSHVTRGFWESFPWPHDSIWRQPLCISWRCLSMEPCVSQLQTLLLSSCASWERLLIPAASVSSPEINHYHGSFEREMRPSMQTPGTEADAQSTINLFYHLWVVPGCTPLPDCWVFSRISEMNGWMKGWVNEISRFSGLPLFMMFHFLYIHSKKESDQVI